MYVLSVEDIDLMIMLANNQKVLSEVGRHEKQMDKLIKMGIIRPGGGVLALTELGHKTANALLGRCLGSTMDAPIEAGTSPVEESNTEAATETAAPADDAEASALETT